MSRTKIIINDQEYFYQQSESGGIEVYYRSKKGWTVYYINRMIDGSLNCTCPHYIYRCEPAKDNRLFCKHIEAIKREGLM